MMNDEKDTRYDPAETDRVMAELKARLAAESAPAAAPTPPEEDTKAVQEEKKAFVSDAPVEADAPEEPVEQEPIFAKEPPEETSKESAPEKKPIKELSYAQRGNVFAPFGFAGAQPTKEEPAPAAPVAEQSAPAAEAAAKSVEPAAPMGEASAAEAPVRESRVFAPFGLKDTKIEATGLRAKVEAERAAKEAEAAERAAKEAAEQEARLQAAEAAHRAEVITPTEVEYQGRGRVFAPFGFDKNASVRQPIPPKQAPAPEAKPQETKPTAEKPAEVQAETDKTIEKKPAAPVEDFTFPAGIGSRAARAVKEKTPAPKVVSLAEETAPAEEPSVALPETSPKHEFFGFEPEQTAEPTLAPAEEASAAVVPEKAKKPASGEKKKHHAFGKKKKAKKAADPRPEYAPWVESGDYPAPSYDDEAEQPDTDAPEAPFIPLAEGFSAAEMTAADGEQGAPSDDAAKRAEGNAKKEAKLAKKRAGEERRAAKAAAREARRHPAKSVQEPAKRAPAASAESVRASKQAEDPRPSAMPAPKKPRKKSDGDSAIYVVPNKKAAMYRSDGDNVTLQCGGQTVVIPADTERFLSNATPSDFATPDANAEQIRRAFFPDSATSSASDARKARDGKGKGEEDQLEFKRSVESSEEDFRLLLGLDYEKELGTAIGYEKIREYHERGLNGTRKEQKGKQKGKKQKREEYGNHTQASTFNKKYAKKRRRLTIELAVSTVLLILMFVYERLAFMHRWFGGEGENRYPFLYVFIGLLLFSVGVIILRRQLFEGFRQMMRLAPTDHSLCSVTVVLTYLYHFLLFFLPREGSLSLYLSPAACSMTLLSLASLMDGYRESAAFRVVAENQPKYSLLTRVSVANSDGGAADRLLRPEKKEATYYVRPVDFVRNYFANTEKKPAHNSFFGSLLMIILSIGAALSLYAAVMGAGARAVVHTAFVTVMLCLPAMSVLITSLPMFLAAILRLKRKGAIIGEETVYNQPDEVTLVLPEEEIFQPMVHEQFEIEPDVDAVESAVLIRALLERIGSPMVESVSVDPVLCLSASAVTLTEIAEDGVSAAIIDAEGTRRTVLLGSVAYLQRYEIALSPKEEESEELSKRLLCVAVDGRLTALFLARYRLEGEIIPLVNRLAAENVTLTVRTKDPGVHASLMERLCVDANGVIRVVKPLTGELDLRLDRAEATVVALGSGREAARVYAVCRRVRRAGSFGGVLQILSTLTGILICGLLAFFGLAARVPAYAVTLYMLLWCALHGLVSYLHLREKSAG